MSDIVFSKVWEIMFSSYRVQSAFFKNQARKTKKIV